MSGTDDCKYCGHPKKHHKPPAQVDVCTSGGSSGKSKMMITKALTNCYANPLCSCIEFVGEEAVRPYWFEFSMLEGSV